MVDGSRVRVADGDDVPAGLRELRLCGGGRVWAAEAVQDRDRDLLPLSASCSRALAGVVPATGWSGPRSRRWSGRSPPACSGRRSAAPIRTLTGPHQGHDRADPRGRDARPPRPDPLRLEAAGEPVVQALVRDEVDRTGVPLRSRGPPGVRNSAIVPPRTYTPRRIPLQRGLRDDRHLGRRRRRARRWRQPWSGRRGSGESRVRRRRPPGLALRARVAHEAPSSRWRCSSPPRRGRSTWTRPFPIISRGTVCARTARDHATAPALARLRVARGRPARRPRRSTSSRCGRPLPAASTRTRATPSPRAARRRRPGWRPTPGTCTTPCSRR